jgi:hypothetical protein
MIVNRMGASLRVGFASKCYAIGGNRLRCCRTIPTPTAGIGTPASPAVKSVTTDRRGAQQGPVRQRPIPPPMHQQLVPAADPDQQPAVAVRRRRVLPILARPRDPPSDPLRRAGSRRGRSDRHPGTSRRSASLLPKGCCRPLGWSARWLGDLRERGVGDGAVGRHADHPVAKPGRADPERGVEPVEVDERQQCGDLDELLVAEVLLHLSE